MKLSGCATARTVTVRPGKDGVVAVSAQDNSSAREKAAQLMSDNCGGKTYQILEEGEAVVGSKTHTSQTEYKDETKKTPMLGGLLNSYSGGNKTHSHSDSDNRTEWRITYECNG